VTLSPTEIAEAFSRHEFQKIYPQLAADIRWTLVGDRRVEGRDGVIATCEDSAAYLATVDTAFREFRTLAGADFAVVDSVADYTGDEEPSTVASCDIYRFAGDQLVEITSYTVVLGTAES
jgi:hypothetical protein